MTLKMHSAHVYAFPLGQWQGESTIYPISQCFLDQPIPGHAYAIFLVPSCFSPSSLKIYSVIDQLMSVTIRGWWLQTLWTWSLNFIPLWTISCIPFKLIFNILWPLFCWILHVSFLLKIFIEVRQTDKYKDKKRGVTAEAHMHTWYCSHVEARLTFGESVLAFNLAEANVFLPLCCLLQSVYF